MNEDRICSRGYWDPASDHPALLSNREVIPEGDGFGGGGGGGNGTAATATLDWLLREELFRYAKKNMALVNVYIKDPVI